MHSWTQRTLTSPSVTPTDHSSGSEMTSDVTGESKSREHAGFRCHGGDDGDVIDSDVENRIHVPNPRERRAPRPCTRGSCPVDPEPRSVNPIDPGWGIRGSP